LVVCPQDDRKRLTDRYYRNGSLICNSAAGEETHTLIIFKRGETSAYSFRRMTRKTPLFSEIYEPIFDRYPDKGVRRISFFNFFD